MDAIEIVGIIAILLLLAFLAIIVLKMTVMIIKDCAAQRIGFLWIYKGRIYRMKEPDWSKSKYLNKYARRNDKYLGCFATIDDDVMI